jgi:hypothetical protein
MHEVANQARQFVALKRLVEDTPENHPQADVGF